MKTKQIADGLDLENFCFPGSADDSLFCSRVVSSGVLSRPRKVSQWNLLKPVIVSGFPVSVSVFSYLRFSVMSSHPIIPKEPLSPEAESETSISRGDRREKKPHSHCTLSASLHQQLPSINKRNATRKENLALKNSSKLRGQGFLILHQSLQKMSSTFSGKV
ncbi:hypothetical protein RRG08_038430 [Elysia crispata]|uniref:Uncharacterized protein n=1 Tax=Elysia crispata TaxID=231223 RepID=A0AAE1E123_9GAST|nr:hypothetical protein RRG08_038430 [Elysia crispata]